MPGDKWPEHTPDIGWSGRLLLLLAIGIVLIAAVGWLAG